jgi:lipoprotein-anchoring transpeptidase ErfK/SrfK
VLAGLATLIPVIPIVIGVLVTSGGGGASAVATAGFTPVSGQTLGPAPLGPAPLSNPGIPQGSGTLVALVMRPTTMRAAPAGRPLARLGTRTEFGSPEVLWVAKYTPGWLGVVSTLAGNGRLGWIPQSTASLSRNSWKLKVSLSARQLTVIDGPTVIQRYTVAIGRPDAPTPTGRFAVTDRLATGDPTSAYGCCILALSARSPHAIQNWGGGDRIAIHSTPESATIGQPVSHGCLRLTLAEGRWLMLHVPLGTPTLITS